jgi:hypothetical protein
VTEPPRIHLRLDKNQPGPQIPSALETYRALREDGGEYGKRIKSVLERPRSNPGKVRGESLRYRPDGWIVLVEMTDGSTWWIIWRQPSPDMVDVFWIGPDPASGAGRPERKTARTVSTSWPLRPS